MAHQSAVETGKAKPVAIDPGEVLEKVSGEPRYNRRLADKILAAFNQAYASGAMEVAETLRRALERSEEDNRRNPHRTRRDEAMNQVEAWVAFVEARNRYREISESGSVVNSASRAAALAEMKATYKRWSEG